MAPLMGRQMLEDGTLPVRQAWKDARRTGSPRIVNGPYFSLGHNGDATADEYIHHYYGDGTQTRRISRTPAAWSGMHVEHAFAGGVDLRAPPDTPTGARPVTGS